MMNRSRLNFTGMGRNGEDVSIGAHKTATPNKGKSKVNH